MGIGMGKGMGKELEIKYPRKCGWCKHYRYCRPAKKEGTMMLGLCLRGRAAGECVSHKDTCRSWVYGGLVEFDIRRTASRIVLMEDLDTGRELKYPVYGDESMEEVWSAAKEYMGLNEDWDSAQRHITVRKEYGI